MIKRNAVLKSLAVGSLLVAGSMQPLQAMGAGTENGPAGSIPLRTVAESIGAHVQWDAAGKQATVKRGQKELVIKSGANGAALVDGKVYVALDTIRQGLQVELDWTQQEGLTISKEDIQTRSSYFVYLLQNGKFAAAREMMNARLQQLLPEQFLQMYWMGNTGAFGAPSQLIMLSETKTAVHHNATLGYVTAEKTPIGITVRYDSEGKIDDLFMPVMPAGAYQQPSYDNPAQYEEQELVIGQGANALPATLTIPKGDGPFPAVVLVHGSGPSDRDETVGAYKPFRDLAAGLAANHIAVLRFEKQTMEHTLQSGLNPAFTVKEESIDDALAAVKALQGQTAVDSKRIYVLGHSQGGMLVPRIVKQDSAGSIAGTIVMAGPSGPLEDLLLAQYEHLVERAKEAQQPTEALEQQVQIWKQTLTVLKDPKYTADNLPAGFQLQNAAWWLDFRNYYAGELAKEQTEPMLILQGENDAQVGMDQLEGWKQALVARKDISFKSYPKLNHFFVSSEKPSTGEEYAVPGNIPEAVISDIAGWINADK